MVIRALVSFVSILILIANIISCAQSVTPSQTDQSKTPSTMETSTLQTDPISTKYSIEFIANWSVATHPDNYPGGAHFSPFVAYSHNDEVEALIYQIGQVASPGVEDMAETGSTNTLNQEIDQLISSTRAYQKTQGRLFDSPGTDSSELEFTRDYSYVTFVSMIAPSPDWFVSVSTNLLNGNDWINTVELELITYDAGSDSGETFTSQNNDTQPKESITVFSDNLQYLGKLILTRIS